MSSQKRMFIASDHAGIVLKAEIQASLPDLGWVDLGANTSDPVDYPDYAGLLCKRLQGNPGACGVLICGSGVGMSIAANKFSGIRAAVVENPVAARLSKEHNQSNVLCLGARFIAPHYAVEIIQAWAKAQPSSDLRHQNRVRKIQELDSPKEIKK